VPGGVREGTPGRGSVGQEVRMKWMLMLSVESQARFAPLSGGCGGNGKGRDGGKGGMAARRMANGCADKIVQFGICRPVNLS